MQYTVVENTPGYLPDDTEPFVGTFEECAEVMDETIKRMIDDGYEVVYNDGVGFRLYGGTRRTFLKLEGSQLDLGRVVEVLEVTL